MKTYRVIMSIDTAEEYEVEAENETLAKRRVIFGALTPVKTQNISREIIEIELINVTQT